MKHEEIYNFNKQNEFFLRPTQSILTTAENK